MPFESVRFAQFRNFRDSSVETDAERIFLVGENGQGKTNFLEALYYLCYGSSFRGQVDQLIPSTGTSGFSLKGIWRKSVGEARRDDVYEPADEISINVRGASKEIRLDGRLLKDRKELVQHNPAVVFCHEDFSFAAGDPEMRRFFFDQCAGILSVSYIDSLRSYRRTLKQRNAALKEGRSDVLDAIDPQFARLGLGLMAARDGLHAKFRAIFPSLYEYVSELGREVSVEYSPSWPRGLGEEEILGLLREKRGIDLTLGTSRSGPHRDRWGFRCEGANFAATASTGQLRLVSLILRIAEARLYAESRRREDGKRWPVLLLDDVLLELDVPRRRRLLELLPGRGEGAQTFFTFLPQEPWTEYKDDDTLVYRVIDGRFES